MVVVAGAGRHVAGGSRLAHGCCMRTAVCVRGVRGPCVPARARSYKQERMAVTQALEVAVIYEHEHVP